MDLDDLTDWLEAVNEAAEIERELIESEAEKHRR